MHLGILQTTYLITQNVFYWSKLHAPETICDIPATLFGGEKKISLHSMQFSWNSGIHVSPALTTTVTIKNESQIC